MGNRKRTMGLQMKTIELQNKRNKKTKQKEMRLLLIKAAANGFIDFEEEVTEDFLPESQITVSRRSSLEELIFDGVELHIER